MRISTDFGKACNGGTYRSINPLPPGSGRGSNDPLPVFHPVEADVLPLDTGARLPVSQKPLCLLSNSTGPRLEFGA